MADNVRVMFEINLKDGSKYKIPYRIIFICNYQSELRAICGAIVSHGFYDAGSGVYFSPNQITHVIVPKELTDLNTEVQVIKP